MTVNHTSGDIIHLAKEGYFDVIVHGCNCFCMMGAGLAPQMAKAFNADKFPMEGYEYKGDINKLGTIDYELVDRKTGRILNPKEELFSREVDRLIVVNAYTQYKGGANLDMEALTLCFRKINDMFANAHIGIPQIGCGIAGGNWEEVRQLIIDELPDLDISFITYKP